MRDICCAEGNGSTGCSLEVLVALPMAAITTTFDEQSLRRLCSFSVVSCCKNNIT